MVIFRAMVNQSEMTSKICPIDASAIRSARESLQSRFGHEITNSVCVLCPRPVGIVTRDVQRQVEWRLELMRTELL